MADTPAKGVIHVPFEVDLITCKHCDMVFVLHAYLTPDDKYGKPTIMSQCGVWFCPYCGAKGENK